MKKVSELGLEMIQLEDQVLLVEKQVGNGKLGDWVKLCVPVIGRVEEWSKDSVLFCNKVIASTKPLEGLPLLIIEDEVENTLDAITEDWYAGESFSSSHIVDPVSFKQGYKASQKSHPYSEEDLRSAISLGRSQGYEYASTETYQDSENLENLNSEHLGDIERFIQSLNKKELWIEVEENETKASLFRENDNAPFRTYQPKIEDGKLKAMWK